MQKVQNFIFTKLHLWQVCHEINKISFHLLFAHILGCWLPAAMSTTSSCHTAARRFSEKQQNTESCYSVPPKITTAKFGASKQQGNMPTFWFPRMYQLARTWSLRKNSFIGRMKRKKITSSSSLPSLRVGGIPGCLAVNNSIKLWVAWSLYKHTKGSSYDSQCMDSKGTICYHWGIQNTNNALKTKSPNSFPLKITWIQTFFRVSFTVIILIHNGVNFQLKYMVLWIMPMYLTEYVI